MVGSHFCGIPENRDFNTTNTKLTNTHTRKYISFDNPKRMIFWATQ